MRLVRYRVTSLGAFDGYKAKMLSKKHAPPPLRYGIAVLVAGVALGVESLLGRFIPQDVPFLLMFCAIMVSVWYGGPWPGLLTMVVAGLATEYSFLDPEGSAFGVGAVPLLVLFVEGTLVCLLTGALRTARWRLEASSRPSMITSDCA